MRIFSIFGALAALIAAPASAQSCIPYGSDGMDAIPGQVLVRYNADWSDFDHFNSSGNRLTTAGQVLQQDRANVHKFGKFTNWDSHDGYFTTLAHRKQLASATVTSYCPMSPATVAKALVNQQTAGSVVFFRAYDGSLVAVVELAG
ncbi:MAG: hypothetical protein P8X50_03085 [Maritimibacter sp.]|jgi:hypothetical protein